MSDINRIKYQKKSALKLLKDISKDVRNWTYLSGLIGVLSGILLIIQMFLLSNIIHEVYILNYDPRKLSFLFILLFIIIFLRSLMTGIKEVVGFKSSAIIRSNVRLKLLKHINSFSPLALQEYNSGALVSSLSESIEALHKYFVFYLPQVIIVMVLPILIIICVFNVSLICGIILLISGPLIPVFMALIGMGADTINQKYFQYLSRMSAHFLDTIQGLRTLKLLGKSKSYKKNIMAASDGFRKRTMSVLKIAFLSSAVLELFSSVSIALIAIYLGMGFINSGIHSGGFTSSLGFDGITLEGALFILLLCPEFFLTFRELGTHYHSKAEAIGATIEIHKILDFHDKYNKKDITITKSSYQSKLKSLEMINLSLRYDGRRLYALNGISLSFKSQQKVAIVGRSGAGKSSLFNLLLKFIEPTSGKILINNQNIKNIKTHDLYSSISWLKQNPTLFSETIKYNLLIAAPNASDAECWEALKFSNLFDFVSNLPNGLDTFVGDNNLGLSGGQVQRIALARIYLQDRELLLLDEPTSSLDQINESIVLKNLSNFWHDKTVIILSHRYEVLSQMDRVIVLEQGNVIQDGKLANLLADKLSLMSQLMNEWKKEYE